MRLSMTVRLWNLRLLVVWINKNAPHFLYHWKCGVGIATIAIMCSDSAYGNGLRLVLQNLSKHILVFETPEAARKELGKKKPMLWIVTEPLTKQPDQPWRADKRTPVILLSNQPESEIAIEKNAGKLTVLPLPVLLETLRNAVKAYLLTKEDKS